MVQPIELGAERHHGHSNFSNPTSLKNNLEVEILKSRKSKHRTWDNDTRRGRTACLHMIDGKEVYYR
jgi:hypothetical protein